LIGKKKALFDYDGVSYPILRDKIKCGMVVCHLSYKDGKGVNE
jgi:hypothetical protein